MAKRKTAKTAKPPRKPKKAAPAKKAPAAKKPAKKPAKRGRGRPPYKPTKTARKTVKAMIAYGIPQETIADVLEIDAKTLAKHFAREIRTAGALANAKVAESLFKNATKHNNVTAQIFWLKTKAGFKPVDAHEIVGGNIILKMMPEEETL